MGSLSVLSLALLCACASTLKKEEDISKAPAELEQKFEELQKLPESAGNLPPPPPVAVISPIEDEKEEIEKAEAASAMAAAEAAKSDKESKKAPTPVVDAKNEKNAAKKITLKEWSPTYWPFGIGEKLSYVMRYGVLEGGIVNMEVSEPQKVGGEAVLHYSGRVKSSKVLELFYKIDDTIDSWVRFKDHLPVRQEIKQLESPKWGRRVVVFDHNKNHAKYYSNTTFKEGRFEEHRQNVKMLNLPQEVFGAMYFYRFIDNLKGVNFPVYDRFQNWNNELVYMGNEKVTVPAGTFESMKFAMRPRVTGDLEPKGDVILWIKDDPTRILLQFQAKIRIGTLTGELKQFTPGRPIQAPLPRFKTPTTLNRKGQLKKGVPLVR